MADVADDFSSSSSAADTGVLEPRLLPRSYWPLAYSCNASAAFLRSFGLLDLNRQRNTQIFQLAPQQLQRCLCPGQLDFEFYWPQSSEDFTLLDEAALQRTIFDHLPFHHAPHHAGARWYHSSHECVTDHSILLPYRFREDRSGCGTRTTLLGLNRRKC